MSRSTSGGFDPVLGVSSSPRVAGSGYQPRGGGVYKVGRPYTIGGTWYTPREQPGYDATGIASWYGSDFHGRKTSNGEIYDMNAMTAAHPTLPMPSYAYVTNLDNGRTILLRINDRGPYVNNRVIDLSRAAASALGSEGRGLGRVRVRYAGKAPLNGDDSRERRYLASQPWTRPAPAYAAAPMPSRRLDSRFDDYNARPLPPPERTAAIEPLPRDATPNRGWSALGYRGGAH